VGCAAEAIVSMPMEFSEMTQRIVGEVKWFSAEKGYGFIKTASSSAEVFVHYTAIEAKGYRTLNEGDRVEFEIGQGPKGPQASKVRVVQAASSDR
jgi:CspA family cold shock protein